MPEGSSVKSPPDWVITWYCGVPRVKVKVSVSPDAVTEAIGGVELGGGCGSGQSCDAVSDAVQAAGEGCVAVGVAPPQAARRARARNGARRRNGELNGREG